jgi:gliding motility-associated lipoprotein GldH
LYEQVTSYPDHQWASKQINQYQFKISDTNALYNMYFVIRHHNAYHYKNIWLQVNTQAAGDSLQKQTININLADDMNGWMGAGMDDIYDHRVLINNKPMKLPLGAFKISTQQIMREDPLQNILTTGIRVEKAKP